MLKKLANATHLTEKFSRFLLENHRAKRIFNIGCGCQNKLYIFVHEGRFTFYTDIYLPLNFDDMYAMSDVRNQPIVYDTELPMSSTFHSVIADEIGGQIEWRQMFEQTLHGYREQPRVQYPNLYKHVTENL